MDVGTLSALILSSMSIFSFAIMFMAIMYRFGRYALMIDTLWADRGSSGIAQLKQSGNVVSMSPDQLSDKWYEQSQGKIDAQILKNLREFAGKYTRTERGNGQLTWAIRNSMSADHIETRRLELDITAEEYLGLCLLYVRGVENGMTFPKLI